MANKGKTSGEANAIPNHYPIMEIKYSWNIEHETKKQVPLPEYHKELTT